MNNLEYVYGQSVMEKRTRRLMFVDIQISESLVQCVYFASGRLTPLVLGIDEIEPKEEETRASYPV
ncbi:hypothetical protein [Leptospira alstonii]|uniref:hypothetical protein n=1 Tax=Leptospira alstonii TaxID=28452 RepID=UPI0012DDF394|nr:hypothetical protein [Leptospira alstonii]